MRYAFVVLVLALTLLVAACGGSTESTATGAPATTAGSAPTETAGAVQATTSTAPETNTADDAQASYREDVQKWWDKWTPKMKEQAGALESDLFAMTDDQIEDVGKFAGVVNDAAEELRNIEPPASAATVHADYAAMLQGMANGLERLQKALDEGELSGLMEALGALEAVMQDSDAKTAALEQAVGVKLKDVATNGQPSATTSTAGKSSDVGSKDNPVPLGTAQQVGDWAVTVVKYTPDATAAVLEANEFNDEPAAGETYVLVALTAKYTGEESGTFWADTSYKFLGKSGNTFDPPLGMAVAPKPISDAGEAFPGASVSGDLLFAVPTDQAVGGLLIMEPSFSFDDDDRAFFALQ